MARDIGVVVDQTVLTSAARAGCTASITASGWRRWASATFVGARHSITIQLLPEAAADAWLAGLSEAGFVLRGNLVADLKVAAVRRATDALAADLEILTVETE